MKKTYTSPSSVSLAIIPSSMLAASVTPSSNHETMEQHSTEMQFDSNFEDFEEEGW